MKTYSIDEKYKIFEAAQKYGGGFAKNLIKAYHIADLQNAAKIEKAFPELLKKYLDMSDVK